MSEHTPGPWTYEDGLICGGPDGQNIARIENRGHSSASCNTRLIAAAPDLLAAVGSAIWVFNNLHNAGTDQFRKFAEAALTDCREALAKVKGESL